MLAEEGWGWGGGWTVAMFEGGDSRGSQQKRMRGVDREGGECFSEKLRPRACLVCLGR